MTDIGKILAEHGPEVLNAPGVNPELIADINVSPALARFKDELVHGERVLYELSYLKQIRLKEANDRIERSHIEGVGTLKASFTRQVFNALELAFGRGWWRDRKRLHTFLQEHPEFAVKTKRRRVTVPADGFRDRRQRSDVRGQKVRGAVGGRAGQLHERTQAMGAGTAAVSQKSRRPDPWMIPVMEAAGIG